MLLLLLFLLHVLSRRKERHGRHQSSHLVAVFVARTKARQPQPLGTPPLARVHGRGAVGGAPVQTDPATVVSDEAATAAAAVVSEVVDAVDRRRQSLGSPRSSSPLASAALLLSRA